MSARFWVGGTGNWDAVTTTHWSASSGGAGGASVPGASDTVTFDASSGGGTVTITADHSVTSVTGGAFTGTLNYGTGRSLTYQTFNFSGTGTRSLTLGNSTITITGSNGWNIQTTTNLTFSGASSTITFTGSFMGTLQFGSLTYGTLNFTGAGDVIPANINCTTFNRTGTAVKTCSITFSGANTITGTLTLAGNSSVNRLLVASTIVGTARTITAATVVCSNSDFQDITGAGAGSWDFSAQTDIGDCGGNSGITFPASVAQTWSGTSGGNWSTNAWTTRVPLPQDDVSLGVAFSASQTVTADMPRLGRSISWTGATGSPTFTNGSTAVAIYGNVVLISGMTVAGSGVITLAGRSAYSITSSGKTFTQPITLDAPSGSISLNDALVTTGRITPTNGGFTTNNFSVTCDRWAAFSGTSFSLTGGTSTFTITSTGGVTVFQNSQSLNPVFSMASTTIVLTGVGSGTKTFSDSTGHTFGTLTYTVAGSTGGLDIIGSNSFAQINFSDASNARTLRFTAGTTTTIRNGNGFNVIGTSGKLMTLDTITGTGTFTLTSTLDQRCQYLSVKNSTVDSAPKWYAGTTSTNVSGNTNWLFTAAPTLTIGTGRDYERRFYEGLVGNIGTLEDMKGMWFCSQTGISHARSAEKQYLVSLGATGKDYHELWFTYLGNKGFTGSLDDRRRSFFTTQTTFI